jgi:hypothetical protein
LVEDVVFESYKPPEVCKKEEREKKGKALEHMGKYIVGRFTKCKGVNIPTTSL